MCSKEEAIKEAHQVSYPARGDSRPARTPARPADPAAGKGGNEGSLAQTKCTYENNSGRARADETCGVLESVSGTAIVCSETQGAEGARNRVAPAALPV